MTASSKRYFKAQNIFPATGTEGIENGVVVVEGERITYVGPADAVSLDPEAGVEEFTNCTILPGLVDAHCHLTLPADNRSYEEMHRDPDEMLSLIAVRNLQLHLAAGVTTARENGGRNRVPFVVREAMRRGYISGPELLVSGRPVTHSHGHFHFCNGVADGEEAIRSTVRTLVAEGADHIKIMASGGGTVGTMPCYASYNALELGVAVDTAHDLGRLTTAHCRATQSISNALDAGLDCIEHSEFLVPGPVEHDVGVVSDGHVEYDPRVAERIAKSGTYVSFTFQGGYGPLVEMQARKRERKLTPREQKQFDSLQARCETKVEIFNRLAADGVKDRLLVSTDAGPGDTEFGRMVYGLRLAVMAGYTPAESILSATRIAATACGVGHRVGTLEQDKQADILIVEGNPMVNIDDIARVRAVFKRGTLLYSNP